MKNIFNQCAKRLSSLLALGVMFLGMTVQPASAAILFQDDTFHDIESDAIRIGSNDAGAVNTAIQFGNDVTASENGNITWDITTNSFTVDHTVNVTGGLSATGQVDFSGAAGTRLRESSSPNTLAACATLNEVIINTTSNRLEICTTTGAAGVAVWTAPSPSVPTGAANPGTCSVGQLFFNTTSSSLQVCTAANTWNTAGPQNFEEVYAWDSDDTLTTGGGNFTVATGGGNINNTLGAGEFDVTTTGLIDFNAGTFDVDTTGAATIDANGASNFTTTAGNLTLSTVTSGAVNVTGADNVNVTSGAGDDITFSSGDDITFDDAQLLAAIQLTNTATGFAATLTGGGILDNINSFTSTAAGEGASNIGINDAGAYFTGTDVESALQELGAVSGANAPNNEVMFFYPEYPDTVIFRDGSANNGTLASDYDDTNDQHYYRWTTNNAALQDIQTKFRFLLPADFTDVNDFTYNFKTTSTVAGDNNLEYRVYNATDETAGAPTLCGSDTTNTSAVADTWTSGTITEATLETGCTGATALNAGDVIEVDIKFFDNNGAADAAYAGFVALGYDN